MWWTKKVRIIGFHTLLERLCCICEELCGIRKELEKMNEHGKAVTLNLRAGSPEPK